MDVPGRVLVLDGADAERGLVWGLVGGLVDGVDAARVREGVVPGRDGAALPGILRRALVEAGWTGSDGIVGAGMLLAVVVGPGSFTGLRATLALARGLAAGSGAPAVGLTAGAAMLPAMAARAEPGTVCWWTSRARRGRVFIETADGIVRAAMLDALPDPGAGTAVVLGGGAAAETARALDARGMRALPDGAFAIAPVAALAAAARWRLAAANGALPVPEPLYVDPPEAALPVRPAAGT